MKKRLRIYAVIGVVIILIGLLLATTPRERLLYYEEYTPLEFYPTYYYANFTVASSVPNAQLSFDLELDFGGNYTDCGTLWILYQLLPEQFEEIFNITEARYFMSGEDWDVDDFDAFWAGWFFGNSFFPFWTPVPSGAYVLVFWFDHEGPTTDWSATLTVSLRTSLLPI